MQKNARVVIIGGGIMGVSLLHALAAEGWSDTLLIEKGELTSGSTWHAAGLCANFIGGSYSMAKIHSYAIDLYSKMHASTGHYISWHGCGGLRLAYNKDEVDWFHLICGYGRSIGFHMEVIGPEEIAKVHPFLNLDGVMAAVHTKNDGHVDPAGCCNALAAQATALGASIVRRNRVTAITQRASGGWDVETEQGSVTCEHVVNAGGCYARKIQAMVGGDLPIINMLHHYIVTDPIEELQDTPFELPVVRDPISSCYLRQEQKSGLIGPYQTAGANEAWPMDAPDWRSENELFEPDYERIGPWLEKAMQRIPLFEGKGIRTAIHGAIPHTPDGNPLLGPVAGLKNFWLCCGTAIGIVQGPGCGKYLAQWMVHGTADIAMQMFDPRRFGPYASIDYARAKSHREYEKMYRVPLPGEEFADGRPVRQSPLYDLLAKKGAVHTEAGGWERPKWFSLDGRKEQFSYRRSNIHEVVAQECAAVRQRVGIMDMTSFAKYEISGAGAEDFLNRITANRMATKPGGITLTHMLTPDGRIETEFTVTRLRQDLFYILTAAAAEGRDLDLLELARVEHDGKITIANVTEEFGVLVVAGPRARDLLAPLSDQDLTTPAFRWLTGREINVAGVSLRALRVNYVGELGWELHAPIDQLAELYNAIWSAGEALGIADFGAYAMNSLRMEKAYRGWGSELTNEISPLEADMARFIKFGKADFIGREALLARQKTQLATAIVYLKIDATTSDVHGGEPVFADDKCIGITTSGAYGHAVSQSLAFAYVDPQFTQAGTALSVDILGQRQTCTVLAEPAYDPTSARLRA